MEIVQNLVNSFKQFATANFNDAVSRFVNHNYEGGKADHLSGRSFAYKHLLDWITSEVEPKLFGTTPIVPTTTANLNGVTSSNNPTTVTESIPLDSGN